MSVKYKQPKMFKYKRPRSQKWTKDQEKMIEILGRPEVQEHIKGLDKNKELPAFLDSLSKSMYDKSFTPDIVKTKKEAEEVGPVTMKIPIPKSILSDKGKSLYKHIAGDTLFLNSSELRNLEKISNREYSLDKNKFQIKDKEKYTESIANFKDAIENELWDEAELHKGTIEGIRPEVSDSLNNVIIEAKKPKPKKSIIDKFWNLLGY